MTPTQYVRALKKLGLPDKPLAMHRAAADLIGITVRQSFRYAAGTTGRKSFSYPDRTTIPEPVARLLACYLAHGWPGQDED